MADGDGWDVDTEFDSAPTRVAPPPDRFDWDTASANVVVTIEDPPTQPRCGICASPVVDLGPIIPDAMTLARTHPMTCARGGGNTGDWYWCVTGLAGKYDFRATIRR